MIGAFVGTRCRVVEQLVGGCTDRLNQFADTHEYARREAPRVFSLPLTILGERHARNIAVVFGLAGSPFSGDLINRSIVEGGLSTFAPQRNQRRSIVNIPRRAITSSGCVVLVFVVVVVIVTVATV